MMVVLKMFLTMICIIIASATDANAASSSSSFSSSPLSAPALKVRGGGGLPSDLTTKSLAILTLANGSFMSLNPEKASTKLYKISNDDTTPASARLIWNNGMSALSLATTSALMAFTKMKPGIAIAAGLIPRLAVLIFNFVSEPVGMDLSGLVPTYIINIVCAYCLVVAENKWINSNVAARILGGIYISAGLGVSIAPKFLAKLLLKFDTNPIEQRCLRAQGKTDIINGFLCWFLISDGYDTALGISCLAWIVSTLLNDIIIQQNFGSDPLIQLLIAALSSWSLLATTAAPSSSSGA